MELLTPFPIVLAVSRFTDGNRRLIVAAIAALMAGSIFLCGSRGGMLAFCVQMIVLAVLLLRSRQGNWKNAMVLGGILLVVIGFLVWLGGNEVTHRLASIHTEAREESPAERACPSIAMACACCSSVPSSAGAWGRSQPSIPRSAASIPRSSSTRRTTTICNCWSKLALPDSAIAAWFLMLLFRKAASKLKNWTETATGALTVCRTAWGCRHSCPQRSRFQLQIPANAAMFYVFCAIAAGVPLQESNRRRVLRRRHHAPQEPIAQNQPFSSPCRRSEIAGLCRANYSQFIA